MSSASLKSVLGLLLVGTMLSGATERAEAQFRPGEITRSQSRAVQDAIRDATRSAVRESLLELRVRKRSAALRTITLSADGRYLVTVHDDSSVRIWDLQQGIEQRGAGNGVRSRGAAVASGQDVAATGGEDGAVGIWDVVRGDVRRQLRGHQGPVQAVQLSPDGKTLVSGGADATVRLWNVEAGQPLQTMRGHQGEVTSTTISPDRSMVLSGGGDGTARLWEARNGRLRTTLQVGGGAVVARFARQGGIVVTGGSDGTLTLWDARSGKQEKQIRVGTGSVGGMSVSDPAGLVAISSPGNRRVTLVDLRDGREVRAIDTDWAGATAPLVEFNANGTRLFTGSVDGSVRIWDVATGRQVAQIIPMENGWTVIDGKGRFDGSEAGIGNVDWQATEANNRNLPLDAFSEPYYEPGLLAKHQANDDRFITRNQTDLPTAKVLMPPRIVSISEVQAPVQAGTSVRVTVTAVQQGDAIADVRLFHNGKALPASRVADRSSRRENDREVRAVTYTITPAAGSNRLEAVGVGANGNEGERVAQQFAVAGAPAPSALHFVAIGINRYRLAELMTEDRRLVSSVADATVIVKRLSEAVPDPFEKVLTIALHDEQATKEAIQQQIASLERTSRPDDVVGIFFAGHGLSDGPRRWFMLPHEISDISADALPRQAVSADWLRDQLSRIPARRVIILLDSCESGAGVGSFDKLLRQKKVMREVGRNSGVAVLAAVEAGKNAKEITALGHGILTYTLLEGLAGEADRRADGDGVVSAHNLASFVRDAVPELARRHRVTQVPVVFPGGEDFALVRSRGR